MCKGKDCLEVIPNDDDLSELNTVQPVDWVGRNYDDGWPQELIDRAVDSSDTTPAAVESKK